MKRLVWSEAKNRWLKEVRGVCFEQVAVLIERGAVLDVVLHPDQDRYPDQKIAVVELGVYAYLVPFDEHADEIRLRTVIPSRKSTRKYLGGTRS